jgi:hypothetical protein
VNWFNKLTASYTAPIIWAAFILFACGAQPSTLAQLKLSDLFSYDKPIHALLFGIQAWLFIKAYGSKNSLTRLSITFWCLLAACYGALIEGLQKWWFVGRSYDFFDMLANTLGCIITYVLVIKKRQHV